MVMPLVSLLLHKKPPRSRSSNVFYRSGSLHDLYTAVLKCSLEDENRCSLTVPVHCRLPLCISGF